MTGPIHDLLDQTATRRPDHPALITLDGSWTYAELALATRQAAAWLRTQGVGRGDRVAIMLPSGPDTVLACYAASRLGAIFVLVSPQIKSFQLGKVLGNAEPALLITDRSPGRAEDHSWSTVTRAQFRAGMRRTAPVPPGWPGISTDPACLIYTSGSTADPKGVVSPHRTMQFAAAAIGGRLGLRAADVIGCFLPLSFDYGLYQIFLAAQAGATLVLGDPSEVGPGLLPRLRDSRVTVLPLVPSMAAIAVRLARRVPADALPPVRMVTNTGAHLASGSIAGLRSVFPGVAVYPMFGMTECKRIAILDAADVDRRPGSVGRPLPDTECLIADDAGHPLPPGEVGELIVRGPHVMAGYWRSPEQTAQRFRPCGAGTELALHTGDYCSADADGYLYFHGRGDDIYKSRGTRVSTLEVEAAALDIPGVQDAAVVPPGSGSGAVLFATGSASADAVQAGLRDRLEPAKVPDEVRLLSQLPLSVNGKVDRHRLREATGVAS